MSIEIRNRENEYTEEFEGINEMVGLFSGDLYESDKPIGYYVAIIFPGSKKPMSMLISGVNERKETTLTIGVSCPFGRISQLQPINPKESPWGEDEGGTYGSYIPPEDYSSFSSAQHLYSLSTFIIKHESELNGYLNEKYA